jgi:hypothetical protein
MSAALRTCLTVALSLVGCAGSASVGEARTVQDSRVSANGNAAPRGAAPTSHVSDELRAGFRQGCEAECMTSSTAERCASYCGCLLARLEADDFERRLDQIAREGDAMMRDPFFQYATAACGPFVVEDSFVQGCAEEDPRLLSYCSCLYAELFRDMSREEAALYVLQNPEMDTTPDGNARIERSSAACLRLYPGQSSN